MKDEETAPPRRRRQVGNSSTGKNVSHDEVPMNTMLIKLLRRVSAAALLVFVVASAAQAHRPLLERSLRPGGTWETAAQLADPTLASQAVYGRLSSPSEVDFYKFTSSKADAIPFEALVPVRPSDREFRPWLVVIGKSIAATPDAQIPFALPEGYQAHVIRPPAARTYFYEPYSLEYLYHGTEEKLQLAEGETYYVAIFDPEHHVGDYSLGLGSVENFEGASKVGLAANVLGAKLGLEGGAGVPVLDLLAVFVSLVGFSLGLGTTFFSFAAENLLGSDGRGARAQLVASRLAWLGLLVALLGSALLYRESVLSGVAAFQGALFVLIILLQIYLSIRLSRRARRASAEPQLPGMPAPKPFKKLTISHALTLLCWCGLLFFFAWYALVLR